MSIWESNGKSSEWYTPKYVFDALGCEFDMDVAAAPEGMGHVPAKKFLRSYPNDKWEGFIWCNPPWSGRGAKMPWIKDNVKHRNGILLTPDRTSVDWWQLCAHECDRFLLVLGKIKFIPGVGNDQNWKQPGNGTTLFAFGTTAVNALHLGESNGLGLSFKRF